MMIARTFLVVVSSLMSFSASADLVELSSVTTVTNVFERIDTKGLYSQTATNASTKTSTLLEIGAQVERYEDTSINTEFVGKEIIGHNRINLVKDEKGATFVEQSFAIHDQISGATVNVEGEGRIQVEIIKGSWDDYLAGNTVAFKTTEAGEEAFLEISKKIVIAILQPTVRDIKARLTKGSAVLVCDGEPSNFRFLQSIDENFQGMKCEANLYKIRCQTSPYAYSAKIETSSKTHDQDLK